MGSFDPAFGFGLAVCCLCSLSLAKALCPKKLVSQNNWFLGHSGFFVLRSVLLLLSGCGLWAGPLPTKRMVFRNNWFFGHSGFSLLRSVLLLLSGCGLCGVFGKGFCVKKWFFGTTGFSDILVFLFFVLSCFCFLVVVFAVSLGRAFV